MIELAILLMLVLVLSVVWKLLGVLREVAELLRFFVYGSEPPE